MSPRAKLLILMFGLPFVFHHRVLCQQLTFSPAVANAGMFNEYSLLSKNKDRIFVLGSSIASVPEILVFDDSLTLTGSMDAPVLTGSSLLAVARKRDTTYMLAEYPLRRMNSYRIISLDEKGTTSFVKEVVTLKTDSATAWSFVKSPGQSYFLLYKVNRPGEDSISINFVVLDSAWNVQETGVAEIPFTAEFERLNPAYIDDHGGIWLAVFDQPLNYKLGSFVNLYSYRKGDGKLYHQLLQTREKKPVEFTFVFDEQKKETTIHSLYVGFFSHDIEGYITGTLNDQLDVVRPLATYEFGKGMKKAMQELTVGITRSHLMNYLKILSVHQLEGDRFCTAISLNYAEYKTFPSSQGSVSTRSASITEQNPLRTAYQRDGLIRQLAGTDRRRSRIRLRDGIPVSGSAIPVADAMRMRPDLFFFPDNTGQLNVQPNASARRIYDKLLFLSFNDELQVDWQQWYKKEYFPVKELNSPLFNTTRNEITTITYQHNKKDKPELLISTLDNKTGLLKQITVGIPGTTFPLLTQPALKINEHEIVFVCSYSETATTGICRLTW